MPDPKQKKFWEYRITSPFGAEDSEIRPGPHKGVDFAMNQGDEVTSYAPGRVIKVVRDDPSFGNYVIVKTGDGTMVLYAHLDSIDVKPGTSVSTSVKLGTVGSTGISEAPHLHVEITPRGATAPVDPATIIPQLRAAGKLTPGGPPVPSTGAFPAQDDDTKDKYAELLRSLGYMSRVRQGTELFPEDTTPITKQSGLFTRPPSEGTGQDILQQAPSFREQVGPVEAGGLLPFLDSSMGGKSAFAENIIRGMGLIPGRGNPFVQQMEGEVERLAMPVLFSRLARGGDIDQRGIADEIIETIRSGRRTPITTESLGQAYAAMPKGVEEQTMQQQLLSEIGEGSPGMIKSLIGDIENLPPDLARFLPGVLDRRHRAAIRASAGQPQSSLVDFLLNRQ